MTRRRLFSLLPFASVLSAQEHKPSSSISSLQGGRCYGNDPVDCTRLNELFILSSHMGWQPTNWNLSQAPDKWAKITVELSQTRDWRKPVDEYSLANGNFVAPDGYRQVLAYESDNDLIVCEPAELNVNPFGKLLKVVRRLVI